MYEKLVSQLGHVELLTPRPQESLEFFTRVMGMEHVSQDGRSAYLRCWGDYYGYSVVLTDAPDTGLGHAGWRTQGPDQLAQAIDGIEQGGVRGEWLEDQPGHGPAYRYRAPRGHVHELFWEVDRHVPTPETASTFPARPQRPTARGISPRQLDHLTVASSDPYGDAEWYRDALNYRFMEYTGLDEHPDMIVFAMVTANEKSHDLGLVLDLSDVPGRLHHLAFWVDTVEDVLRAADVVLESGTAIELGPGRHGMGEQTYLYFREPGGNRLEINSGGYRNYVPDWEPVKWLPAQGSNTMYRNLPSPDSMMEAFPPAGAGAIPEPQVTGLANPWAAGDR